MVCVAIARASFGVGKVIVETVAAGDKFEYIILSLNLLAELKIVSPLPMPTSRSKLKAIRALEDSALEYIAVCNSFFLDYLGVPYILTAIAYIPNVFIDLGWFPLSPRIPVTLAASLWPSWMWRTGSTMLEAVKVAEELTGNLDISLNSLNKEFPDIEPLTWHIARRCDKPYTNTNVAIVCPKPTVEEIQVFSLTASKICMDLAIITEYAPSLRSIDSVAIFRYTAVNNR
ncbi:hypothetical protein EDB81DRAFT_764188 [Dactylonectria macrodidyma]|uniref:Uncharacterized protein n=1 Tax=Dactylonectria macrodidyma TaxID=307937 RepID=A0A9P9DYY5_9HYPO|nr:hypothetical protein EDB81DRAFT_764188 [Dactylonectria macrodidyma]